MTRVSILQFAPVLGDIDANISKVKELVTANAGSDLYVLPELASSGYNFANREQAVACSEEIDNSRYLDALEEICYASDCYIVSGFNERDGDKLYNTAVLISPEGLGGVYRKLHLFDDEKDIFEPGDLGMPIYETPIGKIGMLICFDWMFPEVWRKMAMMGAQIIAHPCCLVLPYCQRVVPSHAIINRMFVATANRVGSEGSVTFNGESVIVAPNGEILASGAAGLEDVLTVDVDLTLADDKMITSRNHALQDRRVDMY
jgi:predicted amidohydrolase